MNAGCVKGQLVLDNAADRAVVTALVFDISAAVVVEKACEVGLEGFAPAIVELLTFVCVWVAQVRTELYLIILLIARRRTLNILQQILDFNPLHRILTKAILVSVLLSSLWAGFVGVSISFKSRENGSDVCIRFALLDLVIVVHH